MRTITRTRSRSLPAALACLALAACATGDDATEPGEVEREPGAELAITLHETEDGDIQTWNLVCEPPGGDHPDPEAACEALEEAGGAEAFEPVPDDVMCTEEYGGPQTADVQGTVDGELVRAEFSRENGCEIARWDALAPLLGIPGGV